MRGPMKHVSEVSPLVLMILMILQAKKKVDVQLQHGICFLQDRLLSQDEVHAMIFWEASSHFSARGEPNEAVPRSRHRVHIRSSAAAKDFFWRYLPGVANSAVESEPGGTPTERCSTWSRQLSSAPSPMRAAASSRSHSSKKPAKGSMPDDILDIGIYGNYLQSEGPRYVSTGELYQEFR